MAHTGEAEHPAAAAQTLPLLVVCHIYINTCQAAAQLQLRTNAATAYNQNSTSIYQLIPHLSLFKCVRV
jgi:hypothetical protein